MNIVMIISLWQTARYIFGCFLRRRYAVIRTMMYGIISTMNALCLNAAEMSPVSNECITRCEPQPGQRKPVSCRNRHLGNKLLDSGLTVA